MKNFKILNYKKVLILVFLLFIYIIICATQYVDAVSNNLCNSVFRLHIIANSDSEEDQNLKYKVRDNIISYMNTLCINTCSKEEAINIATSNIENFKKIAKDTIINNGFNYSVDVSISNCHFPTKTYGDISLPEGFYDALRIKIGNSEGKNWWCVMFPPLCFVDVSSGIVSDDSKDIIKDNISDEEYTLISEGNNDTSNNTTVKFKFKLVEFFNNSKFLTAQN